VSCFAAIGILVCVLGVVIILAWLVASVARLIPSAEEDDDCWVDRGGPQARRPSYWSDRIGW